MLLGGLALWLTAVQYTVATDGTVFENVSVSLVDRLTLTSPDFPQCCERDFTYFIHCTSEHCGLKIVFLDVSLPESATLKIQESLAPNAVLVEKATWSNGVWSRPSVAYYKADMAVILRIPHTRVFPEYSGVKLEVQAYFMRFSEQPDVTSDSVCGRIMLHEWRGGEIKLIPTDDDVMLDCLWVVTTPADAPEEANVFIRFTYTSNLLGIMSVRNGSNSASPSLFYHNTWESGAMGLRHGREGFMSPHSLYVRIKKANNLGAVTFVYGMFVRSITDSHNETCKLGSKKGFLCRQSQWCVPWSDRCDLIKHCPMNEDEQHCKGFVRESKLTTKIDQHNTSPPSITPLHSLCELREKYCPKYGCVFGYKCPGECYSFQKLCDDNTCVLRMNTCHGECRLGQKKCKDGQCVMFNRRCPAECDFTEKKCRDGTCVDNSRYCSYETCPRSASERCGDMCYGDAEKCNGHRFCRDGSDEADCSKFSFPWYIVLVLVGVFGMVVAIIYSKKRNQSSEPTPSFHDASSGVAAADSHYPIIAGARGPARPTPSHHPDPTRDEPASVPLTHPEPTAPPSYTEAMDEVYNPSVPTAPPVEFQPVPPPPYESVAATNMPPKTGSQV